MPRVKLPRPPVQGKICHDLKITAHPCLHQIQTWATLNNWRNAAGELLHNKHIKYATRCVDDEGISTVDHILNSGLQSVLQAEGLLISTDADIAELSDHRPIWAHYPVAGGRGTQGRVKKGRKPSDSNC